MVLSVAADPPAQQDVVYRIYDDPNDPNSDIVFTVWMKLTPEDQDGDSVGWDVKQIRFRQIGQGNGDTLWTESDPNVPTGDGLWWVDHADADNPQLSEFDNPPRLQGLAPADDPVDKDLDYELEGDTYTGTAPWPVTAGLKYKFGLDGEPTPLETGEDEPVGVGEDDDEPPVE
jgi:hypothetical protein